MWPETYEMNYDLYLDALKSALKKLKHAEYEPIVLNHFECTALEVLVRDEIKQMESTTDDRF